MMICFQYNFPVDDYIDNMIVLLKGVIPQWQAFGLNLDIDYDELQVINAGKLTPAECMMKLLAKWIKLKAGKATTYEIIQACERIGNFDLAERLQNKDDTPNIEGARGMYSVDAYIMNNVCSFILVVCNVFYEDARDTWKAHVVIARPDKEKVINNFCMYIYTMSGI